VHDGLKECGGTGKKKKIGLLPRDVDSGLHEFKEGGD